MKKLIFALFAVALCTACEKGADVEKEDPTEIPELKEEPLEQIFTMSADDLIGTYWTRARGIFSGVRSNGEKYTHDTDKDLFDLAGWGSEYWYFVDYNRVIVYYDTDYPPFYLYEETTYQYDPVQQKLTIGESQYDLLQFTPEQFVYTYVYSNVERIYYFRPFTPSEKWFEHFKDAPSVE